MLKFITIFYACASFLFPAIAGPAASVQYVHNAISSLKSTAVPLNPAADSGGAANMEYLLKTVDSANKIICGRTVSSHGAGSYATLFAADTVAANKAIRDLMPAYQAVQYIEFTGTQHIVTGVNQLNASAEVDFQSNTAKPRVTGTDMYVFGGGDTYKSSAFFFLIPDTTMSGSTVANKFLLRLGTSSSDTGTNRAIGNADTNRNVVKLQADRKVYLNGTQNGTTPTGATLPTVAKAIVLGNTGYSSYEALTASYAFGGKIYRFKIWKSDVLTIDFIPVRKLGSGEYGMLDLVSGNFFGNSGTGALGGGAATGAYYKSGGGLFCN